MSTAGFVTPPTPTTGGDWTELASRENDGLEISLLWCKSTGQVKVTVADCRFDETFDVNVVGADALAAFQHPFAFAADRGVCFGDPMRESNDLQLRS
jgi:hypothetical protein